MVAEILRKIRWRGFTFSKAPSFASFVLLFLSTSARAHVSIGWDPLTKYPSVAYNFRLNDPNVEGLNAPRPALAGRPFYYNISKPFLTASEDDTYSEYPKILITPFSFDDSEPRLMNITLAAKSIEAKFILLVLQNEVSPSSFMHDAFFFWWNHKLPQLDQYLGSNTFVNESRPFFLVVPSWVQHDFLHKLLDGSDVLTFDDVSFISGSNLMTRAIVFLFLLACIVRWVCNGHTRDTTRSRAVNPNHMYVSQPYTSEDLGRGEIQYSAWTVPDCCAICLEEMPTGTNVCVLPCRHVFHPRCVDSWLESFQVPWNGTPRSTLINGCFCPLCKFDLQPHLVEHRAAKQQLPIMIPQAASTSMILEKSWKWWGISRRQQQRLLEQSLRGSGDLELTTEDTQITRVV